MCGILHGIDLPCLGLRVRVRVRVRLRVRLRVRVCVCVCVCVCACAPPGFSLNQAFTGGIYLNFVCFYYQFFYNIFQCIHVGK